MRITPGKTRSDKIPAVSVIIPSYNRFSLLSEAAGSVLSQTFRDFELIIVDDGSDDSSVDIPIRGLPVTDKGLIIAAQQGGFSDIDIRLEFPESFNCIRLNHTGMPGAVRNRGAEASRGKYLAFLDSDDLWLPRKLELQTALMLDTPSCRISHTRELWLRNGTVVSQASQKHKRSGDLFFDSLVKCVIGPSTVMLERDLFHEAGGFREDLEIAEDYELWLKITSREQVEYIDSSLTVKRAGHPDQLTSKYGYIEHFRIEALAALLDAGYFDGRQAEQAVGELIRKCTIFTAGAQKRGKIEEAEKYESLARKYRSKM